MQESRVLFPRSEQQNQQPSLLKRLIKFIRRKLLLRYHHFFIPAARTTSSSSSSSMSSLRSKSIRRPRFLLHHCCFNVPLIFWLVALLTTVSCFAFMFVLLSHLSDSNNTLNSSFSRNSSSSSGRIPSALLLAAALHSAHVPQKTPREAILTLPECSTSAPSPALPEAGKIPNPFSNTDDAAAVARQWSRYGIVLQQNNDSENFNAEGQENISSSSSSSYRYSDNMPLIFIGGMPRSGTTLMRAMLDAHPQVRCGTETRLVPRILSMRAMWLKSPRESTRLHEAGITDDVIDAAVRSFILEIMVRHGELAPRLCNKDPFTIKSAAYLAKLFPNAKFIFMIRDGRATVTSIITRQVTITGFNLNDYKQCMEKWSQAMEAMWEQCQSVGSKRCLPVHYEQIVLHPKQQLQRILRFLDLPWNDAVLHHEAHIGETGGVLLSKAERSTDQVIKPVNLDALAKWIDTFPEDVHAQLPSVAPMLQVLGYNPLSRNVSQYGAPDKFVALNTDMLAREDGIWRERQLASVLKGSDSYKFLEREYRLHQQQQHQQKQYQSSSSVQQAGGGGAGTAAAVVAAPNLKADFDV